MSNNSKQMLSQVEVPDGKPICPDPDERTTGVSCVQIYMVWKQGKTHESLDIGTFRLGRSGHSHFPSGTVWTYRLSVWDLNLGYWHSSLILHEVLLFDLIKIGKNDSLYLRILIRIIMRIPIY